MRKDLFVEFPILLPEFILIIGTTCQLVPRPFLNSSQTEQQADGYHGVESMKPCVEITNLLGRASRPEADLILVHWRGIFLISQEKKRKRKSHNVSWAQFYVSNTLFCQMDGSLNHILW